MLYSIDEQYPSIGPVWADGGYANAVDASLIAWADRELGVRLEIVKRNDDVTGSPRFNHRGFVGQAVLQ